MIPTVHNMIVIGMRKITIVLLLGMDGQIMERRPKRLAVRVEVEMKVQVRVARRTLHQVTNLQQSQLKHQHFQPKVQQSQRKVHRFQHHLQLLSRLLILPINQRMGHQKSQQRTQQNLHQSFHQYCHQHLQRKLQRELQRGLQRNHRHLPEMGGVKKNC